jgi:hypothetical protein
MAAAVVASWLGADVLTIHVNLPVVVNVALLLGVPFLWGVLAPASWRSKVGLLFVPLVFLCWLAMSPWSGTLDTPPGWGIIRITLEGAIFVSGAQYLAFRLGLLRWTFTRRNGSRFATTHRTADGGPAR